MTYHRHVRPPRSLDDVAPDAASQRMSRRRIDAAAKADRLVRCVVCGDARPRAGSRDPVCSSTCFARLPSLDRAVALLAAFNRWRRDDTGELQQPDVREIGLAIDVVIIAHRMRHLRPPPKPPA